MAANMRIEPVGHFKHFGRHIAMAHKNVQILASQNLAKLIRLKGNRKTNVKDGSLSSKWRTDNS